MIRCLAISCLLPVVGLSAAAPQDLLRFSNGDKLHGSYRGIGEGPRVVWLRDDLEKPVEFDTEGVRHVVLHGGRPLKVMDSLSYVGLVNGDKIPGKITEIGAETVTLDTPYAGTLGIPRRQVSIIAPSPLGGRVYYHGPFVEDEWKMVHGSFPDGLPPERVEDNEENEGDEKPGRKAGRWSFSGTSWDWREKSYGTALVRETGMPDRAMLRFDVAWKNRLSLIVAFHADFFRPEVVEEDGEENENGKRALSPGDSAYLPTLFGNSYVLKLYSNYLVLYRTSMSEEGLPNLSRVELNNSSFRVGGSGRARVEIRSNRDSGMILLFVDGEYVAQWSEAGAGDGDKTGYAGRGSGFGFVVQGNDNPVRISDVVISEWNGMPDSARSLQVDEHDVVLMVNGTDRYAGRVETLDARGNVQFAGRHGRFEFPIDEVAEIRFAANRLTEASEVQEDNLLIRFSPVGLISGQALTGDGTVIGIRNSIIGDMKVSMEPAVMLDFNPSNQTIYDWDSDF